MDVDAPGHFVPEEAPAEVLDRLTAFLHDGERAQDARETAIFSQSSG
jgi:hypothetical protein